MSIDGLDLRDRPLQTGQPVRWGSPGSEQQVHPDERLRQLCGGLPDGRPLHQYRLSAEQFEELWASLTAALSRLNPERVHGALASLFCLYAAEWCRREMEHGAWSWGPVKEALGVSWVADGYVRRWTEEGLSGLGREVQLTSEGRRKFLMTLACEGGLPLGRLSKEQSGLRDFLRAVLEQLRAMGARGDEDPGLLQEYAARCERHLAVSFRSPVVFRLGGTLVGAVWALREHFTESVDDLLQHVDAAQPAWRETLPVDPSDVTVERLLRVLLSDASDVAAGRGPRLEVRARLVRSGNGELRLAREFTAPRTISEDELMKVFPALPPRGERRARRLIIRLLSPQGASVRAGVLRDQGSEWSYHATGAQRLVGVGAADNLMVELYSQQGGSVVASELKGCDALGELPWVFRRTSRSEYGLLAVGSARHRDPVLWVASPEGMEPMGAACAPTEDRVGDRGFYEIRGSATVECASGRVRICAGTDQDHGTLYELSGPQLEGFRTPRPTWRGFPSLLKRGERRDERVEVEVLTKSGWARPRESVVGDHAVRALDAGELVFSKRVLSVPEDTELKVVRVGDARSDGVILVRSELLSDAGVEQDPEGRWSLEKAWTSAGLELRFRRDPKATPPPRARLTLCFGLETVSGEVTLPLKTLHFEDGEGHRLPRNHRIHLERLGRLRAVGVTPATGADMLINMMVSTSQGDPISESSKRLRDRHGVHELSLREVQRTAERLLEMTPELDGRLVVTLSEKGGRVNQERLVVSRYDWTMRPGDRRGDVVLEQHLDERSIDDVRIESRPFDDIGAALPLIRLESEGSGEPTWTLCPEHKVPGPYLITLSVLGWHRCRPLLITMRGDVEQPRTGLRSALRVEDPGARHEAFRQVLSEMVEDPHHADWGVLDDFLRLLGELPAATFDVLQAVVEDPVRMACVGLHIAAWDAASFTSAWDGLASLSVLWEGIAVESWWTALDTVHAYAERVAPNLGGAIVGHQARAIEHELPTMGPIHAAWCHRRGLPLPEGAGSMVTKRLTVSFFKHRYEGELHAARLRHSEIEELWPSVRERSPLPLPEMWRSAVQAPHVDMRFGLCAPLALAHANVQGRKPTREQQIYLLELRAFDEELFREAYLNALCAIMAHKWGS
ncbi:MAG: hypothetical protein H6741_07205 [Alphaproteobacteria bacterium]|nr:hypothetical protein [Alphaproteobacteria bacterium]